MVYTVPVGLTSVFYTLCLVYTIYSKLYQAHYPQRASRVEGSMSVTTHPVSTPHKQGLIREVLSHSLGRPVPLQHVPVQILNYAF